MPTPVTFRNWAAEPSTNYVWASNPITGTSAAPPARLQFLLAALAYPLQGMVQYAGCGRMFDNLTVDVPVRRIGVMVAPASAYGYAVVARNAGTADVVTQAHTVISNTVIGLGDPNSIDAASTGNGTEAYLPKPVLLETSQVVNDSPEFTFNRAIPLTEALTAAVEEFEVDHVGSFTLIVHKRSPDLEAL